MNPELFDALWGSAELNRAPVNLTCHAKIGQECCLIEVKDYSAVVVFNVDARWKGLLREELFEAGDDHPTIPSGAPLWSGIALHLADLRHFIAAHRAVPCTFGLGSLVDHASTALSPLGLNGHASS